MSSYSEYRRKFFVISLLIIVLISVVVWSWIKIEKIKFYEKKSKLSVLKRSTKGYTEKDFQNIYKETELFLKDIPFYIKYSFDDGIFNFLFFSIIEKNRNQTNLDFSKILDNFANKNKTGVHASLAYMYIGNMYFIKKKFDKAIQYFDKAINTENNIVGLFGFLYGNRPVLSSCYIQRGIVKMYCNDFKGAELDYLEALKTTPKSDFNFFTELRIKGRVVESLLLQNKDQEAKKIMDEIKKITENKELLNKKSREYHFANKISKPVNKTITENTIETTAKKFLKFIDNIYTRLKLTYDLPQTHRKVGRVVSHYRNLKSELKDEFGPTLKPAPKENKKDTINTESDKIEEKSK